MVGSAIVDVVRFIYVWLVGTAFQVADNIYNAPKKLHEAGIFLQTMLVLTKPEIVHLLDISEKLDTVSHFAQKLVLVPDFSEKLVTVPDFSEKPVTVHDFS